MKDVRSWMEKTKGALESPQNKKKPLRDQHAIREKMLADVHIQKTKISLSVEKLQVTFVEVIVVTKVQNFPISAPFPFGNRRRLEDNRIC